MDPLDRLKIKIPMLRRRKKRIGPASAVHTDSFDGFTHRCRINNALNRLRNQNLARRLTQFTGCDTDKKPLVIIDEMENKPERMRG